MLSTSDNLMLIARRPGAACLWHIIDEACGGERQLGRSSSAYSQLIPGDLYLLSADSTR